MGLQPHSQYYKYLYSLPSSSEDSLFNTIMASTPQVSASLLSATNQNNLGLANFTLEFALVKVEAPAEYTGLSTALSKGRRENAEDGPLHRTATKLGLLFEQIIPQIPDLIKAYGTRASEIATVAHKDTQVYFVSLRSSAFPLTIILH